MLGSSLAEAWRLRRPDDELIVLGRQEVDLRDRAATAEAIRAARPDAVIHAAAKVGGIAAKLASPTTYLLDNLQIDSSVIGGALEAGVPELLYIGSAAVYPEQVEQPIREESVLTGTLESANEGYAIAKIAGQKLCEYASRQFGHAYRVALPSNLYGPNDDFSATGGHLIAAALDKAHTARVSGSPSIQVWGDGSARREFTYSADLADWLVGQVGSLATWPAVLNVGVGEDASIAELHRIAAEVVGFEGELAFDTTKPSGVARRLLDSSRARELGWTAPTSLRDGMAAVYDSYLNSERRGPRA